MVTDDLVLFVCLFVNLSASLLIKSLISLFVSFIHFASQESVSRLAANQSVCQPVRFNISINSFLRLIVNDRLSPRGLICQNDFLGSIFKV